jgi:hypothetical protein
MWELCYSFLRTFVLVVAVVSDCILFAQDGRRTFHGEKVERAFGSHGFGQERFANTRRTVTAKTIDITETKRTDVFTHSKIPDLLSPDLNNSGCVKGIWIVSRISRLASSRPPAIK